MPDPTSPSPDGLDGHAASVKSTAVPASAAALKSLRRDKRAARRAIVGRDRDDRTRRIISHALSLRGVNTAATVALSKVDDGEPDLDPLIAALRDLGTTIALPILRDGSMFFRIWDSSTALITGDFGLQEPSTGAVVSPSELDAVIAPLVAFDRNCDRTGRGAGYYDRAFGPVRHSPDRPLLVGAAFEAQGTATVPTRDHDVPMDVIVTEFGIRWRPQIDHSPLRASG